MEVRPFCPNPLIERVKRKATVVLILMPGYKTVSSEAVQPLVTFSKHLPH